MQVASMKCLPEVDFGLNKRQHKVRLLHVQENRYIVCSISLAFLVIWVIHHSSFYTCTCPSSVDIV